MLRTCAFPGAEIHKTENKTVGLRVLLSMVTAWDQKCSRAIYHSGAASPVVVGCIQKRLHCLRISAQLQCDLTAVEITPALSHRSHYVPSIFKVFLIHCCISRLTGRRACLLLRQVLRVNRVHAAWRITSVKQLQCGNPLFSPPDMWLFFIFFPIRHPLSCCWGNARGKVTVRFFWQFSLFFNWYCMGTGQAVG